MIKMHERILPFIDHLEELRIRLLRISVVVLGLMALLYAHTDKILRVIAQPAGHLIFISPAEAFLTYIKVAFWGGIFLASPYVCFELWQFVAEAMGQRERKYILTVFPISFVLFTVGVWFGFAFVLNAGIKFLLSFGGDFMTPMLSVGNYVSFVGSMCLSFGIVFQLPVVIALLTKLGLVTPSFLAEMRRHAVVVIFIAAGILTPSPDIFSQICMAVPLLVLYEVSIIVSRIIHYKARSAELMGMEAKP